MNPAKGSKNLEVSDDHKNNTDRPACTTFNTRFIHMISTIIFFMVGILLFIYVGEFYTGLFLIITFIVYGIAISFLPSWWLQENTVDRVIADVIMAMTVITSFSIVNYYVGINIGMADFAKKVLLLSPERGGDPVGWAICYGLTGGTLPVPEGEWFPSENTWAWQHNMIKHSCRKDKDYINCIPMIANMTLNGLAQSIDTPDPMTLNVYDICYYFFGMNKITDNGILLIHGTLGSIALLTGSIVYANSNHNTKWFKPGSNSHIVLGTIFSLTGFATTIMGLYCSIERRAPLFQFLCVLGYCVCHWITLAGAGLSWVLIKDRRMKLYWHRRCFVFNYFVICGSVSLRFWYLAIPSSIDVFGYTHNFGILYSLTLFLPIPTFLLLSWTYHRKKLHKPICCCNKIRKSVIHTNV